MKMNFRHHTIQAAICMAVVSILTLASCERESDNDPTPKDPPGITFSLGVEQDEVTVEQMTRAAGAADEPLRQMQYFIWRKAGGDSYEIINTPQKHLSPDFRRLTVDGLKEGEYDIVFYATTGSDERIPQPANDGTLTNPEAEKPLNVDYLFRRVTFTVDGTKGEISQTIPVLLKRCVGQVKVELKGTLYEKRLIKNMEFSVTNNYDLTRRHLRTGDYAEDDSHLHSTIKNLPLPLEKAEFYSFPSRPGATLAGTIKVTSEVLNGRISTKTFAFKDLIIEEGKISRIRLDWSTPDGNGVVYVGQEDFTAHDAGQEGFTPATLYEMFHKGESEEKISPRKFVVNKPFQMEIDADKKLHTAFYGAKPLKGLKIMCKMKAYSDEFFQLAYYERYPAFYETRLELPVVKRETTFRTEGGDFLTIPAQPNLRSEDCEFKFVMVPNNSDSEFRNAKLYLENIDRITYPLKIHFNHQYSWQDPPGFRTVVSPAYARLACILAINLAAHFSSEEFKEGVRNYKNIPFLADIAKPDRLISPETIIRRATQARNLLIVEVHLIDDPNWSHIIGIGAAEGGNPPLAMVGYRKYLLDGMFPTPLHPLPPGVNNSYPKFAVYHEWGHVMGYGHESTICSYETKYLAFQQCCVKSLHELALKKKLPVNDEREVYSVIR